MADDIVTWLRNAASRCTHGNERYYNGPEGIETYFKDFCVLCVSWREAAEEIERLRRGEKKVFPPLLHHNGHLEVVKRDGMFGVMLLIDGWYVDKGEAHAVMCDHWSLALEEARRG